MPTAAESLLGHKIPDEWNVIKQVTTPVYPNGNTRSGSFFSVGYEVNHNDTGRSAFLKALDYSYALSSPDTPTVMAAMTSAFNFERDLLYQCKDRRMKNVIHPISHGSYFHPNFRGSDSKVDYIIFEKADRDVREWVNINDSLDLAVRLRCLHQIAKGIHQLHTYKIAHQDIKPSNALVFDLSEDKIGDLGHCSIESQICPRDHLEFSGDNNYSPPELLYGYIHPQWAIRRLGCDTYQFGCLVVFLMTFADMNALLKSKLPLNSRWGGSQTVMYEFILPVVRHAWLLTLEEIERQVHQLAPHLGAEIMTIIRELTDPSPDNRGDPIKRRIYGNPHDLERYISRLDLLAQKAGKGRA